MNPEIDNTIRHLKAQSVIHDVNNQPEMAMRFRDELMGVVEMKRRLEEQEKANKAYWATWPEAEIAASSTEQPMQSSSPNPNNPST